VADVVVGQRVGGFVRFRDEDGRHYAVRRDGIRDLLDADAASDGTIMPLPGSGDDPSAIQRGVGGVSITGCFGFTKACQVRYQLALCRTTKVCRM